MMEHDIYQIARRTKYPPDAFFFVQRGLEFTVNRIHGELSTDEDDVGDRHITGQDLCQGLRAYALESYGLMARTVLRAWSIHQSEDFGHIVFAMVDAEMLRKNDEDTIQDFHNVFDFSEAFAPNLELSENITRQGE